ncbi:putative RNA-directed DNA polymerase from transposon X-element [Araneus ventricosus]|uniref:Putative RNA-directed DNA polymerase from transposon X-element n=1 Tax=Araneus ventricosus TaxID=182803 RepID=A0A4Y2VWY1_ARAVE|nr:putative RNA-directed DNA polymerase from transposon X-element [Araneus ventricosus]
MPKAQQSLALKFSKQGSHLKDLKSKRSVALDLGKAGLATRDLTSLFGNPSKSSELLEIHPSEDDNCRGIRSKVEDIKALVNASHPVCVALQETFLKPNNYLKLRGYSCVRKDNDSGVSTSGGVCIFTSNLYPSTTLNLHTSLQAVAVQVHFRTLVTVCCIYLPPSDIISQDDLNILVDQLPAPFILLGDFNGHSTLWGSDSTNSRGRQIEQFISDNCLCLLNNDEKTYFHEPTRTFHSLDLAICSPELLPMLNFAVGSDLCNSDHFPLIISPVDSSSVTSCPQTYIFQRADWAEFTRRAVITEAMISPDSITDAIQNVIDCIICAADATIPKRAPLPRKFRKPWWNEVCREAYKKQRKLWGIFRRYPTTENLIAFKRARATARRVRRRSQRESWIKYISSITSTISSAQLWKKVKAANGIYTEFAFPILKTGTISHSSPSDIANVIGQTFAEVSSRDSYCPVFLAKKKQAERLNLQFRTRRHFPYNNDFQMFELKRALSPTRSTCPGPDGITYNMLRHLDESSLLHLLRLFNRMWNEQLFPVQWHEAIVIPILKPGKDPTEPTNYRPIALTSCLCKTFERMINVRLLYEIEKNECISPYQSGFRRGRSTIDNLIHLDSQIRNAFVRRNHLVSIFFDIEKAYDRTWRFGILRALFDMGLRGNLPIFIQKFLKNRFFRVRIGNEYSHRFNQNEGVPQGSVLSVTLFILHLSRILHVLPSSVSGTLYVDDLQISCQGSNMALMERQLQKAVNKLTTWCDENGHSLSPEKSRCVHFCRKRNLHPDPVIQIRGVDIPVVQEIRFLGVIFDHKLTFIPHVLHLRKKCERSLNILKVLSTTTWGADRTSLLRIYQSVILSRIDYGCEVYGCARSSILRNLDTVHHSALRICSGAFRTSPVHSLYVVCHQLPLHLRRKMLCAQYFFRIQCHPTHPLRRMTLPIGLGRLYNARPSNVLPFCERIKRSLADSGFPNVQICPIDFLSFAPWDVPQISFQNPFSEFHKSTTAPAVFQQLFCYHRLQFSAHVPIFTDGSKTSSHVGCGIVVAQEIFSRKLHNMCSVLTAELMAILFALEKISCFHNQKFCIYSDSMSALEALSHPHDRAHPLVLDIVCLLRNLQSRGLEILFCWIPSHVGINGNESADAAAKSATIYFERPLPYSDVKKWFSHHIKSLWQELWDQQTRNKLRTIHPLIGMWPIVPMRTFDVKLTRLRIGHSRLTHKHLLSGERCPACTTCQVDLTIHHILVECPVFNNHRFRFFNSVSVNIRDLVGEHPHPHIFTFLNAIGIFNFI